MRLLKNLSIRNKLVLLLVLPLAGLLFFQQKSIVTELSRQNLNKQHQNELSRVEIITSVVDALQKESTLSEIFLSTNQPIDKNELLKQQALTDKAIDELLKNYRTNNVQGKEVVPITDLAAMRNPTHHFSRNAHEINLELIQEINRNYQAAENPVMKHQLQALLTIVYAKEFLTVIKNIFVGAKDDLSLEQLKNFTLSKGKYDFNLQSFKNIASPEIVGYYESTIGETPSYINSRLDSLFRGPGTTITNSENEILLTDLSKLTGTLKKVEDFTLQTIHENLVEHAQ